MHDRKRPGDYTAPVVRYEREFLVAQVFGEGLEIFYKNIELVIVNALRFGGEVVAAHVESDRLMIPSELDELLFPHIPELGKPMSKQNKISLSGSHVVEAHAIYIRIIVPELRASIFQVVFQE